jgi:O-antigen/teichoic acid export membrane protein
MSRLRAAGQAARRSLLLRSIVFSLFAKVIGALMVIVGLPLIAVTLSLADYREFLRSMAAVSVVSLLFGPITLATIVELGRFRGDLETRDVLWSSLRPYLLLSAGLTVLLALAVVSGWFAAFLTPFLIVAFAVTIVQNLFTWADSWRLARRSDFVSSLFQVASTLALIAALLSVPTARLMVVGGLYYGLPMLVTGLSFAAILLGTRWKPAEGRFHPNLAFDLRRSWPLLFPSVIDYGRVYGCGLAIGAIGTAGAYAKYFTIILFLARLVNPVSLITKPLLPAYLDAQRRGDTRWLRRANLGIGAFGIASLVGPLAIVVIVPQAWLTLLPTDWGVLTRWDVGMMGLYFSAYLTASIVSPLYVALDRTREYVIVGFLSVGLGLAAGTAIAVSAGAGWVLYALAMTSMAGGIWYLIRLLPTRHDGQNLATGTAT